MPISAIGLGIVLGVSRFQINKIKVRRLNPNQEGRYSIYLYPGGIDGEVEAMTKMTKIERWQK